MTYGSPSVPDSVRRLQEEFRQHLQVFYARLKLAPPYHSVEQAVTTLTATLNALPPEERARVADDVRLRWAQYQQAFIESGLHLKHRGIIIGLLHSGKLADLPAEFAGFLEAYER